MSERASDIAVALLYETPECDEHLRAALATFGAPVVYETSTRALDSAALERSHANVVLVNLDARHDPNLDSIYSMLADDRYRVVFNDSEVSSALSGWDQARWLRHLAAKIYGATDIDPPRPLDAETVPNRHAAAPRTMAATPADALANLPASNETAWTDDALAPNTPATEALTFSDDWSVEAEPENFAADHDDDAQALFVAPKLPTLADDAVPESVDLAGIEDLLLEFDDTTLASQPHRAMDEAELAFHDDEVSFDDVSVAQADVPVPKSAAPAAPTIAVPAEWSLEDVFDVEAERPLTAASFGIETVSAAEFLAPAADEAPPAYLMPEPAGFSLELIPLEEAVAPTPVEQRVHESWFDPDAPASKAKVKRVWVLGASIGGPESVREFLAELPRDFPALFLLAQHLGSEFVDLMSRQLAKATPLTIRTPTHGERVGHGEVVIVPTTHRLRVDAAGVVVLERNAEETSYSPSIDQVMRDVADRFGAAAGAIVFSGMSTDAIEGCRYLAEKGGRVHAQNPDSCVVSSMVDGVVDLGIVDFIGSPKELAGKLLAER